MSMRLLNVRAGECDDDLDSPHPCEIEAGRTYLYIATFLWNVVDPPRGRELRQFLDDVVTRPNDEGRIILTSAQMQGVLDRLAGLDQALWRVTDAHHRLRPDTVDRIRAEHPLVVDCKEESAGKTYTLENRYQDVWNVQTFLQRAIRLGRDVEID
ncbi:hypothetical protein QTI66_31620 [Variovorax sp. J22R133]|uniref:hypothetical protein n=1 Tax=Variovorax brevis TaxID=3053503 RepID=UPI00257533DD|nr:hypothetical protein [Variovorax sp. J22R133]MDM0116689.1 hypothetical protein [Variovorax sp. J22R133]